MLRNYQMKYKSARTRIVIPRETLTLSAMVTDVRVISIYLFVQ